MGKNIIITFYYISNSHTVLFLQSNYVTFENTGTCSSRIGVAFYPLPISQTINLGKIVRFYDCSDCMIVRGSINNKLKSLDGFFPSKGGRGVTVT